MVGNKLNNWLAQAEELGRERFQPRAAAYDDDARFPFENYADLRDAGFLGLVIPESYGGLGADFESYCLVAAELGRWCGATALTFNMHSCTMMWTGFVADTLDMSGADRQAHDARRRALYRKVVEDGAIFAQPFSEPNSAAAAGKAPFGTTAVPTEGGWLVNGAKHFASLSGAANYYGVLCTKPQTSGALSMQDTLYLAVPADADGFKIVGDWDPLGMRATVSRSLTLENVFVPAELQLMPQGAYYQAAQTWPHMFMTLSPTYMGIARAAVDFTRAYLRGSGAGSGSRDGTGQAKPIVGAAKQLALAEMQVKLEQADALFRRAIGDAGPQPSREVMARAYASQHTVMEYANDICRLAIRICGGRTIMKALPLERLYRDSRCGSLMLPWTADICLERLGQLCLAD